MKKQLTIAEMCAEIKRIYYKKEAHREDIIDIMRIVGRFNAAFKAEKLTKENLSVLLDTELEIANSKGGFKQLVEKELLRYITYFPHRLYQEESLKTLSSIEKATKKEKAVIQFIDFAKQLMLVKIPRESFSGKRKGYAIELLGNLTDYFEFSEFIEICKKALKDKSKHQFFETIQALEIYFKKRNIEPDEEIINRIDKRFEKAKTRSEAVGCLSFLVNTGVISEFEALDRIDEWKEKNDVW